MQEKQKAKILVGFTGSVASIKHSELLASIRKIFNEQVEIRIICTDRALHFINRAELKHYLHYSDEEEWEYWQKRGDPVLHIELRKWADMFLIAPLSANSLAKIANGICDNLLSCVARAWDFEKPFVCAPAMNTQMYEHPITAKHLKRLAKWGVEIIWPIEKVLMCQETGMGAMQEVEEIGRIIF